MTLRLQSVWKHKGIALLSAVEVPSCGSRDVSDSLVKNLNFAKLDGVGLLDCCCTVAVADVVFPTFNASSIVVVRNKL